MATILPCFTCGTSLASENRFCPGCGAGVISCVACGRRLLEGDGFCSGCGTPAASTPNPDTDASGNEVVPGSPWDEVVQRLQRATLGEFEIGRELGRGAMAAVFLAREISLDRKVAIKVMSPGLLMDEGMAERFKREAITIAHLNHPNIVSVHSVRQAAGLHFFVMRYIQGRSLEQVIQRAGRLPIPIVRSILYQVGSALTYAHRSRVVHRDIKPANILIDEDGNAVVTDFGIAKVAELPSETHPGALVGTPAYMSPEQCSGDDVSGASDQYALGVVAYEMITGASPFTGSTFTVMQGHLEQPPRPIENHGAECPPELERALMRMLEKEPAARWPSIAEAKAALGATPLAENDPLLAELCRLATPDWTTSLPGTPAAAARTKASVIQPAIPAGTVRSITILPPPEALETGDTFTLVAMLRGELGVPLPGRTVQWGTDTPEVLRVDGGKGIATAVAPGSARLTATCEGVRARLQVLVAAPTLEDSDSQPGVVAIQVSAPPKSVKAGDSFVLTATPLDHRGGFLLGHTVQWSTSDVSIAVVTASGWVATLGQGTVELKATCQGASASVSIHVQEGVPVTKRTRPPSPGRHHQPQAPVKEHGPVKEHRTIKRRRAPYSRRRRLVAASVGVLLLAPVVWLLGGLSHVRVPDISRPAALPSEDNRAFDVTPAEPVAAILRGAPASVAITRRPRRVLSPGARGRFLAEVRDLAGGTISGSIVRWSSSNPEVVRVDSATGRVRALREGRAWVVAESGEWKDSAALVVRPPSAEPAAAAQVRISPPGSLQVGDTVTLAAAVLDGKGAPLPGAEVAWSATEPSIAAVDTATGHVHALAPGTVGITATSGPAAATSRLTVFPAEVTDTLPVQAYDPALHQPEEPEAIAEAPEYRGLDAAMSQGVQECHDALSSKNVARLTALYRPANASDRDKLDKLTRILRTQEWDAVVGERVDGARQQGRERSAAEFSVQLVWKDAFGGRLSSRPVFRVELDRSGDGWDFSSCRILGSPRL